MFRTFWEPAGFDRMQQLIRDNPTLKAGFAYTLAELTTALGESADTFGESRTGNLRLGFVGVLSVLVRVDVGSRTARVVDVKLAARPRPA
ncbi:MAG: hypothetical protein C0501_04185 [Isosphaera sp.]|nr:hypothetical protein [Isosphaera sp.]